jgi:uncharacterized LabA/DUF88 family protein
MITATIGASALIRAVFLLFKICYNGCMLNQNNQNKNNAKERVCIYIDGSNFYNYLKDKEIGFPQGKKFDYLKFIELLVGDREISSMRYYTGVFRNTDDSEKSKKLVKNQQRFLSYLEKIGFCIKRGRILQDNGRPREKGTDVKIAVDLVVGAIDNFYDSAILVSSDTDLIPAIDYVKYKNKKIEYVGFSHAPSFALIKHSHFRRLLLPGDIKQFETDW